MPNPVNEHIGGLPRCVARSSHMEREREGLPVECVLPIARLQTGKKDAQGLGKIARLLEQCRVLAFDNLSEQSLA